MVIKEVYVGKLRITTYSNHDGKHRVEEYEANQPVDFLVVIEDGYVKSVRGYKSINTANEGVNIKMTYQNNNPVFIAGGGS